MGFFNGVKRVIKPLVDVPRWMQLKNIKLQGKAIKDLGQDLFVIKTIDNPESYEQALDRLKINENSVLERIQELKKLFVFYLACFVVIFTYGSYMFYQHYPRAGFLAYAVSTIALSQAFRQHFWLTQLKNRCLGMNFKKWFELTFLGKVK